MCKGVASRFASVCHLSLAASNSWIPSESIQRTYCLSWAQIWKQLTPKIYLCVCVYVCKNVIIIPRRETLAYLHLCRVKPGHWSPQVMQGCPLCASAAGFCWGQTGRSNDRFRCGEVLLEAGLYRVCRMYRNRALNAPLPLPLKRKRSYCNWLTFLERPNQSSHIPSILD